VTLGVGGTIVAWWHSGKSWHLWPSTILCSRLELSADRSPSFLTKCCYVCQTLRNLLVFFALFSTSEFILCYITHTLTSIPFNSRYQKGKTNLDFTEARDSEWQWHQLGHVQVCTLLQTDNHASTPPLSFLQAGFSSWRPTNSDKALCYINVHIFTIIMTQLEKK